MLIKLEKVGEWTEEESVHYVRKENDVNTRKAISKINRILNHKKVKQMILLEGWILRQRNLLRK